MIRDDKRAEKQQKPARRTNFLNQGYPQMRSMLVNVYGRTIARAKHMAMLLAITGFVLLNNTSLAADDDYLEALEAEAERTGNLDDSGGVGTNTTTKTTTTKTKQVNQSTQKKFEQLLQFELPATYKFYNKLSEKNKALVVKTYTKDKKLSAASKKIFDLYFKK
jgi:hypothetical protein